MEPWAWPKHSDGGNLCLGKAWPTEKEKTPPVCGECGCQVSLLREQ